MLNANVWISTNIKFFNLRPTSSHPHLYAIANDNDGGHDDNVEVI